MRKHTYSKFSPELADAVDLQALLDKLADFLLQSGFAGGRQFHPYWGEFGGDEDRSIEALREAILNALMESGQFTRRCSRRCAATASPEAQAKLAKLLDELVQRLMEEGYLNADAPPQMPASHQAVTGPGGLAQRRLTRRAVPPHRERHRLPRLQDAAQPPRLPRQVELRQPRHAVSRHRRRGRRDWSKPYEFGDVLNLDVNETLKNALARTGNIDGADRPRLLRT